MTELELQCVNVPGGWQTCIKNTKVSFGPVFNSVVDLWKWQKENIYAPMKQAKENLDAMYA